MMSNPYSTQDQQDEVDLQRLRELERELRRPPGRPLVQKRLGVSESRARRLIDLARATTNGVALPRPDSLDTSSTVSLDRQLQVVRDDTDPHHSTSAGFAAAEQDSPPDFASAVHRSPTADVRPRSAARSTQPQLPETVRLMVRFGWQRWVGSVGIAVGMLAIGAVGVVHVLHRLGIGPVVPPRWRVTAVLAGLGFLVLVAGLLVRRSSPRREVRRILLTTPAKAYYMTFALALGASADASFRMWFEVIKVTIAESIAFFAVLEVAMIAASLSMRANLKRSGQPGASRALLWALTGFGIVAAFAVSGWPGGIWRAICGPLAATLALHFAMDVELRAEGARESLSRVGSALRSLGQHLLSYVGAGTDDQTWIVIRHQRAVARAARLASLPEPGRFQMWRLRRARRACRAGITEAGTADLMTAIAAERATVALTTMSTVSPWDDKTTIPAPAVEARALRQSRQAQRTSQN